VAASIIALAESNEAFNVKSLKIYITIKQYRFKISAARHTVMAKH